jgi:hypothetical protein
LEPEEQVQTDAAAQPDQDEGMVEIHSASIEDLDAALASAQAEEAAILADPVETDQSPQAPEQQPNGQVDPQADANPASQSTIATQGADPSKPQRQPTAEELQAANAETERLRKIGEQKESYIQQRGNELGALKGQLASTERQLTEARAQLANGLKDRWVEDPQQASIDQKKIDDIDIQLQGVEQQRATAETIVEAQTFFLRNVDTNQVTLNDIAQVLADDGVNEEYVGKFKANPWLFTTPEALVQMGKRALDRKQFVQADSDRRILAKHIIAQNAEIAKLKGRPAQVMKQVQRNLNASPSVSAQSTVSPKVARDLDPTKMSIKELDAALAQATRH